MPFQCPECDREPFKTLRSWKSHMTAAHSGYTGEQLEELTSNSNEGMQVVGEESLESAIAKLPTSEEELGKEETPEPSAEQKKAIKAASKRIRAKFDSLKSKIATDVPDQAFKYAGIDIEESDKKWLGESIELALEVFGVDFEVQPVGMTIRNPFVILLYPLLVIIIITLGAWFRDKKEHEQDAE